jgi:glycosyltransferase involved in cell wall biosynthesis
MKLLITTQVVDVQDPFTSFFPGWLAAFAGKFDHIDVICLKEGMHALPSNVRVYSLGKEHECGSNILKRLRYTMRLYYFAWTLRGDYDAVLVHMNQEYVLLCGPLWNILRKRVYLWRNHYAGSRITDGAAWWCAKVFCTSRFSYTAKYQKTVLMPVGVDTKLFAPVPQVERVKKSILFFARFAPSKRPHVLVEALGILRSRGVDCSATFYGDALPHDSAYYREVLARASELGLQESVRFLPGIPNTDAPRAFSAHEIYVDLGASGMYNKTIFEAAACGCIVVAESKDFAQEVGEQLTFEATNASQLADRLDALMQLGDIERSAMIRKLEDFAARNSLELLSERLSTELQ